jgi:hypothetical protein
MVNTILNLASPDLIRATASAALCNGMVSTRGRTLASTLKSSVRSFSKGVPVIDPTRLRSPRTRCPPDTGRGSCAQQN